MYVCIKVYLLRDVHMESLPVGFSGFPGHRRAPHQKSQTEVIPLVSATFNEERDDGLGSRRNPLKVTLYEDLRVNQLFLNNHNLKLTETQFIFYQQSGSY